MKEQQKKLIYDITEFEYKREITKRLPYPFFALNKLTGGAEVGGLVILFAKTNAGKSEMATQFMTYWVEQGEKVVAMLGEHTMRKAQGLLYKKVSRYDKDKWITKKYGDDNNGRDLGIYETFISEEDEKKAIDLLKGNLFLYDTRKGFNLDDILKGYEQGIEKGCSVAVLDNQMMLNMESNSELREQTYNTEKLRQWAKEHQIPVLLVGHARKTDVGRIRLTENDLAGSSNIANKATTIMTLTRVDTLNPNTQEYKEYARLLELNYINIKKCDAILEVVKEKNGTGGFVGLKWYESTKTFKEVYDPEMIQRKEDIKKEREKLYGKKEEENDLDRPVLYTKEEKTKDIDLIPLDLDVSNIF